MSGVRVRPATVDELSRWDEIVGRFDNCRLFHKRIWLDWLEEFSGARPLYLVFEKGKDVVACMPGFLMTVVFLRLFVSPREGWQTGSMGPVFAKDRISTHELFSALISYLEEKHGVQHIELVSADLDPGSMRALGFRGDPMFTYRVRLFPGDEEQALRAVHKRTRRYLRNGSKAGLSVRVESEESFVNEVYGQAKEVFARGGNAIPFSRMRALQLFRRLKSSGNLLALSVRGPDGGPSMATCIFMIDKPELYGWAWTHRREYGRYHPTEFMTWAAMRRAMEAGCEAFDMAGGGEAKVKFGAVPDETTVRWMRSRYKWLAWLRAGAKKAYRWQQSVRGRIARRGTLRRSGGVASQQGDGQGSGQE